jgi:hypothetical protein
MPERKTFVPAPMHEGITNDAPVCPYCGHTIREDYELPDDGTVDCDCGKTFYCSRNVYVSYTTTPGEWTDPSTLL